MSKLIYAGLIGAVLMTAACKDAHKTGGATQDSSASHGYSGAAHPEKSTGTAAGTSGTSDMSKKDSDKNQPTDTSKHNIH